MDARPPCRQAGILPDDPDAAALLHYGIRTVSSASYVSRRTRNPLSQHIVLFVVLVYLSSAGLDHPRNLQAA